jgi:hypothetical protein
LKIISAQDYYDRPVLGICSSGINLYLFILQDEDESGKDVFSFTIIGKDTLYDMLMHKKDLHTIVTEQLTFKGTFENPVLTAVTLTEDEKPKKGEFY